MAQAAIVAGQVVTPTSDAGEFIVPQQRRFMFGICESAVAPLAPGDNPTNVVVVWSDGSRVTYADGGQLQQVLPPSAGIPNLLGSVVALNEKLAPLPNPGARQQGPVAQQFALADAKGGGASDVASIKTPNGFITFPVQALRVLPAA